MRLSSFESWTVNEFWKYLTSILFSISLRFKTRDGQCDVNKKMASLLYFLNEKFEFAFFWFRSWNMRNFSYSETEFYSYI